MALSPARTKYRKSQKGSLAGNAKRGNTIAFGDFGLQSLTHGPDDRSANRSRSRDDFSSLEAQGAGWIRVFPAQARHQGNLPKPAWVTVRVRLNIMSPRSNRAPFLFELAGVSATIAKEAFRLCRCQTSVSLPFHHSRRRRRLTVTANRIRP